MLGTSLCTHFDEQDKFTETLNQVLWLELGMRKPFLGLSTIFLVDIVL